MPSTVRCNFIRIIVVGMYVDVRVKKTSRKIALGATCKQEEINRSLQWAKAEKGPTEGQDWLLGPEGLLGHLQPVCPMRRQLAEAGGGAFSLLLQLGEGVFQLAEHVQPGNRERK